MDQFLDHRPAGWRPRADFLLAPLGWTIDRLGTAIAANPSLLEPLVAIGKARLHLVALALAHLTDEISPDLAFVLLRGAHKTVLDRSLGYRPVGLYRALAHLPPKVLDPEIYRKLVDLLIDPATAKLLHHSTSTDAAIITNLHALPASLRRPAIMTILDRIEPRNGFVDGLQFLASRVNLSFDTLATELGALDQPDQIAAKVKQLIEMLPLPEPSLPITIGSFRRVDCVAEIRAIAKTWQNCLAEYLYQVNEGTSAIYLSEQMNAACLCCRLGRLGWFLVDARGPKNIAIDRQSLAHIHAAFAAADILQAAIVKPLNAIILTDEWSRRQHDQDELIADITLY
jgi:hypothetical protein